MVQSFTPVNTLISFSPRYTPSESLHARGDTLCIEISLWVHYLANIEKGGDREIYNCHFIWKSTTFKVAVPQNIHLDNINDVSP